MSAYVTAAHIKFLLLHDGRGEDAVKSFFREVYDAYLRVGVNSHPLVIFGNQLNNTAILLDETMPVESDVIKGCSLQTAHAAYLPTKQS